MRYNKAMSLPARFLLIVVLLFATSPTIVYAQGSWYGDCLGPTLESQDVPTIRGLQCLLGNFLTVALQLLGLVFFIMFLIGGFKYLTAGGDPKALDAAKGSLTGAFTGLILAILSWFILRLIQNITGVEVTLFQWPFPN